MLPSILNLEHVGDTVFLPRKAKELLAEDGLDLQTWSFALVPASDPVPL